MSVSAPFPEEISTVAAAAKYNLTPSYLARLARKEVIHARKFGRDWILDEAALREYLAHPRKTGPQPRRKEPPSADAGTASSMTPGAWHEAPHNSSPNGSLP